MGQASSTYHIYIFYIRFKMQDVRITMSSSRFSIFPTIPTVKNLRPMKDCGENLLTCISVDSDKVSLSSYVLSLAVFVAPLESAVVVVR